MNEEETEHLTRKEKNMETAERISLGTLRAAMMARRPVVLVGTAGTGKTSVIEDIADKMGYECLTLLGSGQEPADVTGLPKGEHVIDDEDGNPIWGTVYLMPWWQIRILQKKKVILFIDELSNVSDAVRASWLTMLQSRVFPNGVKFPAETIVVGAMNPTDEAADGYELDGPTCNRICFISWEPSVSSWLKGMRVGWNKPNISDAELGWCRKIAAFIEDNPSRLDTKQRDMNTVEGYGVDPNNAVQMTVLNSAFATRRSWTEVAGILSYADPGDTLVEDTILQGTVGFSAAVAFREWLIKNDVIDPKKVIADPSCVDWKTVTLNDANIVLRAIVDMIDPKTADGVLNVFEHLAHEDRARLGAPFMREVVAKTAKLNRERVQEVAKAYSAVSKTSR